MVKLGDSGSLGGVCVCMQSVVSTVSNLLQPSARHAWSTLQQVVVIIIIVIIIKQILLKCHK